MANNIYTYTVYDSKTKTIVAYQAPAGACAKVMGIDIGTFYNYVYKTKHDHAPRWEIVRNQWHDMYYEPSSCEPSRLPEMVRASALADILGISYRRVVALCERKKIPMARAGALKIRMISPRAFFEKLEEEDLNETLQNNI